MSFLSRQRSAKDQAGEEPPPIPASSQLALDRLQEANTVDEQLRGLSQNLGFRRRELRKLAGVGWQQSLIGLDDRKAARLPLSLDELRKIAIYMVGTGALRPRSVSGWFRSQYRGLSWRRPLDVLQEGNFLAVMRAAEDTCGGRLSPQRCQPPSVRRARDSAAGHPPSR